MEYSSLMCLVLISLYYLNVVSDLVECPILQYSVPVSSGCHNLFLSLFELEVKSMTGRALWPWARSGPQPAFVNKVLLKHNHTQLFRYCLWLPLHYDGIGEL